MVAGDTKKIIVIKNISSSLIEEVILILKNEPDILRRHELEKPVQSKPNVRDDFILKEAESIINRYIKENGLGIIQNRNCRSSRKIPQIDIPANVIINILLTAAIVFLMWAVVKFF